MRFVNKLLLNNFIIKLPKIIKIPIFSLLFFGLYSCTTTVQFDKNYFENDHGNIQVNSIFTGYYKVDIQPDKYIVCIQQTDQESLLINIFNYNTANDSYSKTLNLRLLKVGPYYFGKLNESDSEIFTYLLIKFTITNFGIDTSLLFFDLIPDLLISSIHRGDINGKIINYDKAKNGIKQKIIIQSTLNEFEKYLIKNNKEIAKIIKEKTTPVRFRRINWID